MIFKLSYDKAVLESDSLTTAEAMVALSWASVCDYKNGSNVRQSFDAVAQKSKMTRRNVIRVTQSLVNKGWLEEVERQPYKPTVYRLVIPTSDNISLVTAETPLVTNETRLVTNEAPTSDTMSPNKKNNKNIDKNKDKNKNSAASPAPGVQENDPNHPLDISTSSDLPLASSTEAVAPPSRGVQDQMDPEVIWDIQSPEASESNRASKDTGKTVEAVREKPRPVLDPSEVRKSAQAYGKRNTYTKSAEQKYVNAVMENLPGWTGELNELLEDTLKNFMGEEW